MDPHMGAFLNLLLPPPAHACRIYRLIQTIFSGTIHIAIYEKEYKSHAADSKQNPGIDEALLQRSACATVLYLSCRRRHGK